jgi:hypothetical protein
MQVLECHQALDGKKSVGAGKAAKNECGANLNENLESLAERLKTATLAARLHSEGKWEIKAPGDGRLRG